MDRTDRGLETLLAEFIAGFYGYGNYQGRYWFVGMEEGGGNSLEGIQKRLQVWAERSQHELENVAAYHHDLGYDEFFTHPTKVQPTWNKLIRLVLSAQCQPFSLDDVKAYQRKQLGRWDGETCLLELLPLPARSTGTWLYSGFTTIPGLHSRETYRQQYAEARAQHIRQRVLEYRPAGVVFYSVDGWYLQWWHEIAGTSFQTCAIGKDVYYAAADAHTRYFVVKHPASRGLTHDYYHHIGRLFNG